MSEDQLRLLDKAEESLVVAKEILQSGHRGFSASRSYYAMFNLVQALLESEGHSFSKHSATISAFGKMFIKTGRIENKFHSYLIQAERVRLKGDYDVVRKVTT